MTGQRKSQKEGQSFELIKGLVDSIQYGTVSIIVQDGRIVQIEKNEKYRIQN